MIQYEALTSRFHENWIENIITEIQQPPPREYNHMAKQKTMNDLFYDGLKDIYYAEKKILKALPKMARGAQTDEVRQTFEKHRDETEKQVERLEQIFELINKHTQGKTYPTIDNIVEKNSEILDEFKKTPALNANLVGTTQSVEHYKISHYNTLKR